MEFNDVGPTIPETSLDPQQLTSDEEIVKKLIEGRVDTFNTYRKARRIQILANIAYLCGEQNIMIRGHEIQPLPEKFATPSIHNVILPSVVNDVAVGTNSPARYDCIPISTSEDDKATAKVAQKMIDYIQRINGENLDREAVILWYDLDGVGWRKVYWDPFYAIVGYNPPPDQEGHTQPH